jgi:hypothetical protein
VKASGKFCLSNPAFTNPDNYRGGGREAEKEEVEKRKMGERKSEKEEVEKRKMGERKSEKEEVEKRNMGERKSEKEEVEKRKMEERQRKRKWRRERWGKKKREREREKKEERTVLNVKMQELKCLRYIHCRQLSHIDWYLKCRKVIGKGLVRTLN